MRRGSGAGLRRPCRGAFRAPSPSGGNALRA